MVRSLFALVASLSASLVSATAMAQSSPSSGQTMQFNGEEISLDVGVTIVGFSNGGSEGWQKVSSGMDMSGTVHQVTVGGGTNLIFSPNTIQAAVGDSVMFTFMQQNHTLTQSAFSTPCVKMAMGMDSGFKPNPNSTLNPPPLFEMRVNVATPLWFYCRQKGHCGKGMVFSINPTAEKTHAQFTQFAIQQNGTAAGTGSTTTVVAPPPASTVATAAPPPAAAPPAAAPSVATGTGTTNANGECSCSCFCGVAAFPSPAIQGMGLMGGLSGALPIGS